MANTILDSVLGEFENNGITRDPKSDPEVRNLHPRLREAMSQMTGGVVEPRLESLKRNPEYWVAKTVQHIAKHGEALDFTQGDPLAPPIVIGLVDYGNSDYQLTASANPNGPGTLLSWTWPTDFTPTPTSVYSPTPPDKDDPYPVFPVTAYYLQRSTSATNMPFGPPNFDLHSGPVNTMTLDEIATVLAQPGWTTIAQWGPGEDLHNLPTPNPLPGGDPSSTYIDPQPPSPVFNYRLIGVFNSINAYGTYSPASPGDGPDEHRIEIDWNVVTVSLPAGSGSPVWVNRFGGTLNDAGQGVAVHTDGSIYVTGYFKGTANFGGADLTSAGGADMFLAKYDSFGDHVWSVRFGGTGDETPLGIALDSSGNAYVCGNYHGLGNVGGSNLTTTPGYNAFIAKYSAASGAHQWSHGFGRSVNNDFRCLDVDASGNVFVAGSFLATGAAPMNFGGSDLYSSYPNLSVCVVKFNTSGVHQASVLLDCGGDSYPNGLVLDSSGNPYLTGDFLGYLTVGNITLHDNSQFQNTFICKLTSTLGVPGTAGTWAVAYGATQSQRGTSIAVDSNGDLAVGGMFYQQGNFGGGVVSGTGIDNDAWVGKYSSVDGSHLWSQRIISNYSAWTIAVRFDTLGNIVLSGYYYGTCNFNGASLSSLALSYDIFVAKYRKNSRTSYSLAWARSFGGTSVDHPVGPMGMAGTNPVVTGFFMGATGPDAAHFGDITLGSQGGTDGFLMKLNP